MEDKHREILRRHWSELRKDLEPDKLLPRLVCVLDSTDIQDIKAEVTREEKTDKLLDLLPRRGPKAFDVFVRALQDVQSHLATLLLQDSENEELRDKPAVANREVNKPRNQLRDERLGQRVQVNNMNEAGTAENATEKHDKGEGCGVIPKEPQKSLPSDAMQDDRYRPQSKRFHIKNLHSTDYELGGLSTSTTSQLKNSYPKKQHFVRGQMAGASSSNHLIYGTDELLCQAQLREEAYKPRGFLYGTEAATNVGKPAPAPRPNNVLWLEEKTETDVVRHKKLANTQDEYLARYYEEKAKKTQAAREEQKKFGHGDKPDTHRTKNVRALVEERYGGRNEDYKKQLEFSIEESRSRKQVQRQRSFEDELQHISTNPFGREGGGAPRRTGQGSVKAGFPTTLSKDIQELRLVDRRHPHAFSQVNQNPVDSGSETTLYHPWGRGHGNPPAFDRQGRMIRAPQQNQADDLEGIGITVGRPGAGAPNVDSHGNKRVKKAQTLAKTSNGQTIQRDFSPKGKTYNPWGRSGAGAPIKDHEGQIQTRTAGRVIHDANDVPNSLDSRAKHAYLTTLQRMAEETKERRKTEHDDLLTAPEKDVATWLGTGTVGQLIHDPVTKEIVAQKKQTSDVTSQALNIRRQKNEKSGEYHIDLEIQARERHQQRKHNQEQERIKSLEHLKTMDRAWGRPGAGAPLRKEHADFAKKQKLGIVPVDSTFTYREA